MNDLTRRCNRREKRALANSAMTEVILPFAYLLVMIYAICQSVN